MNSNLNVFVVVVQYEGAIEAVHIVEADDDAEAIKKIQIKDYPTSTPDELKNIGIEYEIHNIVEEAAIYPIQKWNRKFITCECGRYYQFDVPVLRGRYFQSLCSRCGVIRKITSWNGEVIKVEFERKSK